MICPHCAKDNLQPSVLCAFCQRPLNVNLNMAYGAPVYPPPPPALGYPSTYPAPAPAPAPKKTALRWAVIAIAAFAGMLGSTAVLGNHETPDQHIARLLREASGVQPIHNSIFPSQRRFDNSVREQYRELIEQNKSYMAAVQKLDISETGKINSPESFADPESATVALQQLHASYDLDAEQEQKLGECIDNLRQALINNASSESEKEEYLEGFNKGVAKVTPKRHALITSEKAWIEAVDATYDYASAHRGDFDLMDGKLVIPSPDVRQEFNTKVDAEEARRHEFLQAKEAFAEFQNQTLQKMGVSQKDVGVP